MKKFLFYLFVFTKLCLWSIFLLNQFGIGTAWAKKEEIKDVEKSTEIPEKKPEGMSDLEWEKLKAKKPLPFDKGPDKIDISKYPKEMQDIYEKDFRKKCSQCHTIARAINAPYALPEEWEKYIKKMMKKPGSGINPISAKKIYEFLAYDSKIRKKDLVEKKLKEKEKKKEITPKKGEKK